MSFSFSVIEKEEKEDDENQEENNQPAPTAGKNEFGRGFNNQGEAGEKGGIAGFVVGNDGDQIGVISQVLVRNENETAVIRNSGEELVAFFVF